MFWSYDPVYRTDLVPNIQGKYSFQERPCMAIIVKNSSANHFQLSADNFQGTVISYCHLAKVADKPGLSIEWVREDGRAIADNHGRFPSPRGIYYIEVKQETVTDQDQPVFYVDPLLEVIDEAPQQITPFRYQLQHFPIHPGSIRVYELPGNIPLIEGINYSIDVATGELTLVNVLPGGVTLSVDYRYPGASTGPHLIKVNQTQVKAIPGVVLAFGRRVEAGDVMAVVVGDRREPVALEYGGRWEITLDLDIMARDVTAQSEIADKTVLYLHGIARNRLSTEGIEITQVSMGGESEETYDENADDYYYNASISISLQTDWSIYVPLTAFIQRVSPQTLAQIEETAGLTDDQLIEQGEPNNLHAVADLNLRACRDPFFMGRSKTYEVIR